jgi:prevent-host-death family protein
MEVISMRQYTTGEARDRFSEVVNEAAFGAHRVVLTRHGKTVAAVVPMSDLELLNELERLIDVEEARKALIEAKEGKNTITLKDLKKKLGV